MADMPANPPREGPLLAFLQDVRALGLPDDVGAEHAANAVLCALVHRLSPDDAANLLRKLPGEIAELGLCPTHPERTSETYDRAELLRRVGDHLDRAREDAEFVVRPVFGALQKHLSAEDVAAVGDGLPADIEELWRHPEVRLDLAARPEDAPARPPAGSE